MVVGIIRETDRSIRERMENHMVGDLRNMGYNAFSSYAVFGPNAFENLNEKQITDKMRENGADGVLTIVLLNKEKEKYYVPERVVFSPYFYYYNRFGRYYTTLYNRIESLGYYEVATKYFWESNLYDLPGKQLIYSVQTQSFDPSSSETLAHEYGRLIVENMIAQEFLTRQSTVTIMGM